MYVKQFRSEELQHYSCMIPEEILGGRGGVPKIFSEYSKFRGFWNVANVADLALAPYCGGILEQTVGLGTVQE
jgi:hypothetical protein